MDDLRCPNLDVLGFRLLEAYRQLGDVEIEVLSTSNWLTTTSQVSVLEKEIRTHCQDCAICRAINWQKEVMRAFSKDEPAWRGMMAS
jgi:hypothetical protein